MLMFCTYKDPSSILPIPESKRGITIRDYLQDRTSPLPMNAVGKHRWSEQNACSQAGFHPKFQGKADKDRKAKRKSFLLWRLIENDWICFLSFSFWRNPIRVIASSLIFMRRKHPSRLKSGSNNNNTKTNNKNRCKLCIRSICCELSL